MSYFVVVTFDLNHHATAQDYANAYIDLAALGLHKQITSDSGSVINLPNTTCAGKVTGSSAAVVRDYINEQVQTRFRARGFNSEVFVSVSGDWAWGHRHTGIK